MDLSQTSCNILTGAGPKTCAQLARLQIHTLQDLLFHLPYRYEDRTRIIPCRQLIPGEQAVVEGTLVSIETPKRTRTKLLCELQDDTGRLFLRFFYLAPFQLKILKIGTRLRGFGEIRYGPHHLEIIHPEFQVIEEGKDLPIDQRLTPVYHATEGLGQRVIRKLSDQALALLNKGAVLPELVPENLLHALSLPTLKEALNFVHHPPRETKEEEMLAGNTIFQKRLAFEELLAHRLSLLHVKKTMQQQQAIPLSIPKKLSASFIKNLPFELTQAQIRIVEEIAKDLSRATLMLRLMQGDVGSGKTVVAALAAIQSVENQCQVAIMAPTEILAEQHARTFQKWLAPLKIHSTLLSGAIKTKERNTILPKIAQGEIQVVLGTHALFQKEVEFQRLGLIVIDEQHRFGVQQRALLREKGMQEGAFPHQLLMTATPIPRTLAMSIYADLDCSSLDEMPKGRTPVTTTVLPNTKREELIERLRESNQSGRQAYWICTLIEESENLQCQAAEKTAQELKQALPELNVGLVHGRMKAKEKDLVMQQFQNGEINLLVATTVVEVGVDVPNASLMIIENAERLGLSQLHQLRGRVGRGKVVSHCVLLYQNPLSSLARDRLAVMRETTDGFKIAERDLALRGPGEVLGTRQTGDISFRVANILRDNDLLNPVQQAAHTIIEKHPEAIPCLIKRWLGQAEVFGQV